MKSRLLRLTKIQDYSQNEGKPLLDTMFKRLLIAKHKLIVAEEVVQDGNDSQQLAPMLGKAQDIVDAEKLTGLGDAGYYSSKQIKACEDKKINVYVPIPKVS